MCYLYFLFAIFVFFWSLQTLPGHRSSDEKRRRINSFRFDRYSIKGNTVLLFGNNEDREGEREKIIMNISHARVKQTKWACVIFLLSFVYKRSHKSDARLQFLNQ